MFARGQPGGRPFGGSRKCASVKAAGDPLEVHSIDQQGMRFEPRITALPAGSTVRFGNSDPDLHNVHIGNEFNRGVAPGEPPTSRPPSRESIASSAISMAHMPPTSSERFRVGHYLRSYPRFRFENVPPGRYQLRVWHEMGEPQERDVDVSARPVVLNDIVVKEGVNPTTIGAGETVCATGCEPWPLVIDRIAVTLAASLDAAGRSEAAERCPPGAGRLYRDFEASGMDAAIRVHLGQDRAADWKAFCKTSPIPRAGRRRYRALAGCARADPSLARSREGVERIEP